MGGHFHQSAMNTAFGGTLHGLLVGGRVRVTQPTFRVSCVLDLVLRTACTIEMG